jgi:hypothetical protein
VCGRRSRQLRVEVGAVINSPPSSVALEAPPWLTHDQPVLGGVVNWHSGPAQMLRHADPVSKSMRPTSSGM